MIPVSEDFVTTLKKSVKQLFIKCEFYNANMDLLTTFEENVAQYSNFKGGTVPNHFTPYGTLRHINPKRIGAISVDSTRAIRRSFSFGLGNYQNQYNWGKDSPIWIANRIKIYTGMMLADGTIEYISQGLFVITQPADSHNPKDGKDVYLTGQDKAYLFTGNRGKFGYDTTLESGINIATAIQKIASDNGETMFNFDDVTDALPYNITYKSSDSRWQAMSDLATIAQCEIFYDVNGYLRLQKIVTDFTKEPPVWIIKYGDKNEKFYAGNVRSFDETNLANHIKVVGGSAQTPTVVYDLVVDETVNYTLSETIAETQQFQAGTFSGTQAYDDGADGALELAQFGTNYTLAETEHTDAFNNITSDFSNGTLSGVFIDKNGYLSLITDAAIQFSGSNSYSGAGNTYFYQDIYNVPLLIASGDKLLFDEYLQAPSANQYKSSIDCKFSGGTALRNSGLNDQNGVSVNTATDLTGHADNKWYHRQIDLTTFAGQYINSVQVAFEGDATGSYDSYFKNIYINDINGNKKYIIYDATVQQNALPAVTPSSNGGASQLQTAGTNDYLCTLNSLASVCSSMSGTRTENVIDLSQVNLTSYTDVSWQGSFPTNATATVNIKTSSDGGTTWSAWTPVTSGSWIPNVTQGQNLTNFKIQCQQVFSSTDPISVPVMTQFDVTAKSQFKSSGTFISNQFPIATTSCNPVNNTSKISWNATVPSSSTTMTIQLQVSTNNGQTWSGYQSVTSGQQISQITNNVDISQCLFQFQVSMSTTDPNNSVSLQDLTIQADAPVWQNCPYSIQKIGDVLYEHNNGSPDPLITQQYQAIWRAKYELMKRLGYAEYLDVELAPIWFLDAEDIIQIEDDQNCVAGNYKLVSFEIPLIPQLASAKLVQYKNWLSDFQSI